MQNKVKKRMMILLVLFLGILFVPPCEMYAIGSVSEDIMPMADDFEWRYKIENGVTYKRLYNRSKKQWVGNWIKC